MGKCLPGLGKAKRGQSPVLQKQLQDKQDLGGLGEPSIKFFSLSWSQAVLMHEGMISAWLRVSGKFNKMTHVKVTAQHLA